MKLPKLKTIFVDIDGTICTQTFHPDFDDQVIDYVAAEPIPDRIKHINERQRTYHCLLDCEGLSFWSRSHRND